MRNVFFDRSMICTAACILDQSSSKSDLSDVSAARGVGFCPRRFVAAVSVFGGIKRGEGVLPVVQSASYTSLTCDMSF